MKTAVKIITMVLYLFTLNYLTAVFEIPRNIYFIIFGFPITLGGVFLIEYLFRDKI
ncbi:MULTISPECIES: hypothetical protein [Virgibacillus]|uniref:Uncharacterized protein n=1 Tax=Virgibacillus chiguensis TaxID=411959 RepID=A0A1M5XHK9_9BACI|nr:MULTISPECIES: hypothetical protein [Virgibacillus]SHH99355.1 hypothetical protein SAMN05421807_12718 [Virgibacillus chiguensis]